MWFSSIILVVFRLIYVNGEVIWNLHEDNTDNSESYKGGIWNYDEAKRSIVEWQGLAAFEKEINKNDKGKLSNDNKNKDFEWQGLNNNKYSGDKFETGVSIDYHESIVGKELKVNEEEVTNEENFVRPCPFDDWECIRNFFAHNSDCKPAYGPSPDPLYLKQNTLFFPFTNMTYTLTDLAVKGLSSSKIVEFYYNKKTRDLVFAIQVTNLNETTPKGYFSYRRTAKESIVLADYSTILFRDIIFTAVIPKIPKLRLDLAEIHADIRPETPDVFVGPKAYTSKDPDVIRAYTDFVTFFPVIVREGVFYQAPLYTSLFIQKSVCDFGIKLDSV